MATIKRLETITSIKVGPGSTVLPDGTIINPVPYSGVNVTLDDGRMFQIERPLTLAKIQAVMTPVPPQIIDGITEGQVV